PRNPPPVPPALVPQDPAPPPVVPAASPVVASRPLGGSPGCGSLAKSADASRSVGEVVPDSQYAGNLQQVASPKFLRVLEHEEEVEVSHEDANQLSQHLPSADDHVECKQHPRQVDGLGKENEATSLILSVTAFSPGEPPTLGRAQSNSTQLKGYHYADPVEEQHEEVIGRMPVEETCGRPTCLEAYGVRVEEVQVHQVVESHRVEEHCSDRPPYLRKKGTAGSQTHLKFLDEQVVREDEILRTHEPEAAEDWEHDRQAEPIAREQRQTAKPVRDFGHCGLASFTIARDEVPTEAACF
ncbi:unnamed protein product, partial [Ixodes hexagonus]